MTVRDLNRDQLKELKGNYLVELDNEGQLEEVTGLDAIYWGTLANIDEVVPDNVVFEHYDGITFGVDDFFCTAGIYELEECYV